MPFKISWFLEGKIILIQNIGHVTLDEMHDANNCCGRMVNQGQPPVHILVDIRQVDSIPMNVKALSQISGFDGISNVGQFVIVGVDHNILTSARIVTRLHSSRSRVRMTQSMDEAVSHIMDYDSSIHYNPLPRTGD